jgi:hypothetical protein
MSTRRSKGGNTFCLQGPLVFYTIFPLGRERFLSCHREAVNQPLEQTF